MISGQEQAPGVVSPRLFANPVLEALSVGRAPSVLIWIPIGLALFGIGFLDSRSSLPTALAWLVLGAGLWTLFEYLMHRYLFHMKATSPASERFATVIHGVHHQAPQDRRRSVMPPAPAALIAAVLYGSLVLTTEPGVRDIAFAGFLFGYVAFDLVHHACHHWPMRSGVWRALKRNHMLHHNLESSGNFGVSSPFWDVIFRTRIKPRRES